MWKCWNSLLVVIFAAAVSFAQQPDTTVKQSSQPTIQSVGTVAKPAIKTSIVPSKTTNWSKIKDLFL